ncbi:MAG: hypothetical protein DRQ51_04325 [Gammaproteobacteria bacterium]|nr:MAG: hypothetical protein DRQ51_04325 [Gammaproteobacteria bacterium]
MKKYVKNEIVLDESEVWVLSNHNNFNYSEGVKAEKYLEKVFLKANDLSSTSYELETHIKDWSSEYHLTRKRTQLLRGFDFNKNSKVLEVGAGCGAITRFLGETFDDVVAVEGSIARARLAKLRTKDLNTISILCAPFQKIKFKKKFDIIFCIGVFEYSNIFVDGDDPYDVILKYFSDILSENGVVVIAIENQFGLKYFASSGEDHTNIMFDGIEGYSKYKNRCKTFGYDELDARLKKYFDKTQFYFPYPDYKIPSCVLSEKFLKSANVGELVGGYSSRDYMKLRQPLFDEKLALLEIDKNDKLHFFSHSFLVIASKNDNNSAEFNQLGIMYANSRIKKFQTTTKFKQKNNNIEVIKKPTYDCEQPKQEKLTLSLTTSQWVDSVSLHMQLFKKVKTKNISLEEIFNPCRIWIKTIKQNSYTKNKVVWVDGKYIDFIWRNSFIKNNECIFIDQEWKWGEDITLNFIVIKSIFYFLDEIQNLNGVNPILKIISTKKLIKKIASIMGVKIDNDNFKEFITTEAKIQSMVSGCALKKAKNSFKFKLHSQMLFNKIRSFKLVALHIWQKIAFRLGV